MLLTPVANLPPVLLIPVANWEVEFTYRYIFAFKFTLRSPHPDIVPIICHWWQTSVVDIGANFAADATGVVDTGGAP